MSAVPVDISFGVVFALHLEKCSEDLLQNISRTLLLLESEPAKGKGSEKNAQPTWVQRCLRASDAADEYKDVCTSDTAGDVYFIYLIYGVNVYF
ncbi:unnamed protein product [Brassica oleracea]|uniref:(rape) hypothetical protein n=1 Tax=Brassica napus TaxID=3708 RepID=A0A816JPT0_BRANA|nr:unnamed protein product [Brassica napus]